MKLLMLGGSKAQLPGIRMAQELGHEVVLCDYLEASVGHQMADVSYLVSTFDQEKVLEVAKKEKIDGIMTYGTDQPVLTGAYVSRELGLPCFLNVEQALLVTDKIHMKKKFVELGIATADFVFYEKGVNDKALDVFDGPVVVKPVDSQGQRGIYFIKDATEAVNVYEQVVMYSRQKEILVESYYEHDEVTVSGWVHDGVTHVLTITDRVTFNDHNRIGICLSHELPSKYMNRYGEELIEMTEVIVKGFGIKEGPIYFQFLIGSDGIKVNEVACRIGGAYEGSFMPVVTGFDMLKVQILMSLGVGWNEERGKAADWSVAESLKGLEEYSVLNNDKFLSVQLFFFEPCEIAYMPEEDEVRALDGVMECGFNVGVGDVLTRIENATARGGYVIIEGDSQELLRKRIIGLYDVLKIEDKQGNNHVIFTDYDAYDVVKY